MSRVVYGIRPVAELLRYPKRVKVLMVVEDFKGKTLQSLVDQAKAADIPVESRPRYVLDQMSEQAPHQGVLARASGVEYLTLDELLALPMREGVRRRIILALDQVTDPHNLGAMARAMEVLGGHGLVLMTRRSVHVTAAVCKASAGAVEHLPLAQVVNLSQALERCVRDGFTVLGLDMEGDVSIHDIPPTGDLVLVVGSEGEGLREGVRAACRHLVRIPMVGKVDSLNASVSVAIALSHWL